MKVHHASVTLHGEERVEITDVTKVVREAVHASGIQRGIAIANALHTTCALFINEFQAALVHDLTALVERLVPSAAGYRHDDPRYSDCERGNADAHLRTALLGRAYVATRLRCPGSFALQSAWAELAATIVRLRRTTLTTLWA